MCGGTLVVRQTGQTGDGLSPRVRGNRFVLFQVGLYVGSIPACAGEPRQLRRGRRVRRVYPRVCGGTFAFTIRPDIQHGLSPRVRGNHALAYVANGNARSIPACAGEPHYIYDYPYFDKVYPRVCGGTTIVTSHNTRFSGLSPRVRGNPAYVHSDMEYTRSIPACAGEPAERRPVSHG